jgi:hypothetical protein
LWVILTSKKYTTWKSAEAIKEWWEKNSKGKSVEAKEEICNSNLYSLTYCSFCRQ